MPGSTAWRLTPSAAAAPLDPSEGRSRLRSKPAAASLISGFSSMSSFQRDRAGEELGQGESGGGEASTNT